MERLLALPGPPSAVLCANDAMPIGAMHAAQSSGRRVPQDLSIVGSDDLPVATSTQPALTTFPHPLRAAGHALAGKPLAPFGRVPPGPLPPMSSAESRVGNDCVRPGITW